MTIEPTSPMSAAPRLEATDLGFAIGGQTILAGIDLRVDAGEVLAVTGPSGSGKSTLLHCLAALLAPTTGEVRLDGRRFDHEPERARSALRLTSFGFVLQFGDLVPELTLVENVELPLRLAGVGRGRARRRAEGLMDQLDIAGLGDRLLLEVSGGQAQRAAVARALVHEPAVVFADEPTGSLDARSGELVLDLLLGASVGQGAAVLLVTHDAAVAAHADRRLRLADGQVVL